MNPISLYFHIPFCSRKCDYCHFYVIPDKTPLKKVLEEGLSYEWQSRLTDLAGKKIDTIYFGGGTPALFGANAIGRLLEQVRSTSTFTTDSPEITLEANPDIINQDLMRDYMAAGINRVSIGVQTFNDALLKRIGRLHDAETAKNSVHQTYDAGIDNITIDLMYDLPGQTLESWTQTLHAATDLPISHLSLYNLTIEPRTVFYKYRDTIQQEQPEDTDSLAMYREAVNHLNRSGYHQYEISAFAQEGRQSRHNIGYWTARPFLGFGPSAYSYWNGSRFRNIANLNRWHRALANQEDPIDYRETLEKNAAIAELLAVRLRLLEGVHVPNFEKAHGKLPEQVISSIQQLLCAGLLKKENATLSMTEQGILFYDTIATELVIQD